MQINPTTFFYYYARNDIYEQIGSAPNLRAGMAFFVDFEKLAEVHVGIFLCRSQTLMPQQLLDDSQVCTPA